VTAQTKKRAVAVAVEGARPPAWQARAVELLRGSDAVDLVAVDRAPAGGGALAPLWRLHRAFERRWFRPGRDAFAPTEVATPSGSPGEADLLLWLGSGEPPPGDRAVLWLRYDHGAFRDAVYRSEPAVETQVWLRRAGAPGWVVAARTVSGVRPFSLTVTANAAAWKLAELAARSAAGDLEEPSEPATDDQRRSPVGAPAFLLRSLARAAKAAALRLAFRRPWFVRVRILGDAGWEGDDGLVEWEPGHIYADPVLFEHEGHHHLFVEHVRAGQQNGVISHVELGTGERRSPQPVLERPHHLSYPFVFEHGGELFMIPETSAARRVELHRAVDFPHRWELDTVLLEDVDAVDATVFEHDGRLWMLAGIASPGASSLDELHAFHAESARGPWLPHARNPVVSDVRGARPGGAVLRTGGGLVRPAQDGSRRYGWALSFRHIDVLTPAEYSEHEVDRLEPDAVPGARATHHYARDGRFEAVDGRAREPRLRLLRRLV
jgi:hypothetical protein